jgi:hypothetical protein
MEDYVVDVVVICQLKDNVTFDDADNLHVKKINCSVSYKHRYREWACYSSRQLQWLDHSFTTEIKTI